MNKASWVRKVNRAMRDAGVYQTFFKDTVDALAEILARRDATLEEFEAQGTGLTITYYNKNGDMISKVNPLITLWNTLNTQALSYWKELGLTPSGLKKLNDKSIKVEKKSTLEAALEALGADR